MGWRSTDPIEQDPEIKNLQHLEEQFQQDDIHTGPRYFVQLLDFFRHTGPNGTHNRLVTELLGPTVQVALQTWGLMEETLRPDTVLRASRQLLQGLESAHRNGIVHGGVSTARSHS